MRYYVRQFQYFYKLGWGGKCGNNEVTCHLSGFGAEGRITFDWKHFTYEDYDQWLFSTDGPWKANSTKGSFPDILVVHLGLHTCVHSWTQSSQNFTMIRQHTEAIPVMMEAIRTAIDRTPPELPRTVVIIQLAGRAGNSDPRGDRCSRQFNRALAYHAHRFGFVAFDREEIERRLLFKSEYFFNYRTMKPSLHLENPGPNIVGTSLLGLIGCLQRNGTELGRKFTPFDAI